MNKKLKNKLKKKIRVIPDFPKKGILFQDITSITDNKKLFKEVLLEISKYVKKNKFTKIAAVEARGFIFGSAVSFKYSPDLAGRIIWEETMGQWIAFGFMLGNIKFSMEFN